MNAPYDYFFYENTKEYKKIEENFYWAIVVVLYICALRISIGNTYEFIMNTCIAIATGYIISYFYFNLVTVSDRIRKEILLINTISEFGSIVLEINNIVEKYSEDKLKRKYIDIYVLLKSIQDRFSEYHSADIRFKSSILILETITSYNNIPKSGFISTNKEITILYCKTIMAFKDKEDILKAVSVIRKKYKNDKLVPFIKENIEKIELGY